MLLVSACAQVPATNDATSADAAPLHAAPATPLPHPSISHTPPDSRDKVADANRAPLDARTNTAALTVDKDARPAAPALPPKSVWTRIRNGFAMQPLDNELVHEWENWYATRPDYVARMIDRSSRFLFHVVEQVEKRNMPMEIALLPMIESAYNPVAYSRSHASGIWQFIPSTGKDFGLRQSWWYDGRRDVIAATDAALDYLQKLYGMFGDWQLALAAYNWGEGAVGRAIEKNRAKGLPTDYESLTMPPETRGYVPKLMAVKNIITAPERFGLSIADVPNEPYFETVTVRQHIDLKVAAKLAEMPVEEFKFLNPGHNKPVIKAGEAERIVLPRHNVVTFLSNFEKHDKPLVSWQAVTFRKGDKAEKVAARHGMTLAELKEVNGLAHQRKLVVGQPLLVPVKGGVENPQLPDLPVNPVPLQKAFIAAKSSAHARRLEPTRGRHVAVKRARTHVAQRGAVHHRPAKPAPKLRAEAGKRVKVVAASKKPAARSGSKLKVAAR
jgi:membrane-bound lytic murein transglycosylase D